MEFSFSRFSWGRTKCQSPSLWKLNNLRASPSPEKDPATGSFCDRLRDLGSRLCKVGQNLQSGQLSWKAAAKIEKRSIAQLNQICQQPLRFKPAETLRTFLAGPEQKFLFTFLRRPGVPPTNNHAEQSLRHLVIFRKICLGTRSDSGLKTHSILPSLVQTARRQGVPQGSSCKPSSRQIPQRLKLPSITIQADVPPGRRTT